MEVLALLGAAGFWAVTLVGSVVALYALLVTLMVLNPKWISWFLFAHWLRLPFLWKLPDHSDLFMYRMAAFARNIQIRTPDGLTIRGWHLLPPGRASLAASATRDAERRELIFDAALGRCSPERSDVRELLQGIHAEPRRVIIFFHGNALDRRWPNRLAMIQFLCNRMGAHVITVDPRGFGDSEGVPSEDGVAVDAESVFRWLCAKTTTDSGVKDCKLPSETQCFLYGQSLGTAILTRLAESLSLHGNPPSGLVLDAPFTSIDRAVLDHPGAAPFRLLTGIRNVLIRVMREKFVTVERITRVTCPVFIVHGSLDGKISVDQGRTIFEKASASGVDAQFEEIVDARHTDSYADPSFLHLLEEFFIKCTQGTRKAKS